MSGKQERVSKASACFRWSRLILSASLPIVLAVFSIVFTLQQNSISEANREEDRRQTIELRQQTIYDAYINGISKILLDATFNRSNQQMMNYIGFKTVGVLQHVNAVQKRDIIMFLYNFELLRRFHPEHQRVKLSGANLNNVRFIGSLSLKCKLPYLYLPSVLAVGIVFDGCDIDYASFEDALLFGAKFIGSLMQSVRFYKANLTEASFHGDNLNQVDFAYATLVNARFSVFQPVDSNFTRADLLHSGLTDKNLLSETHKFNNTRFPNGSFSSIDSANLIVDGGAESACRSGLHPKWNVFEKYPGLEPFDYKKNSNQTTLEPIGSGGNCYFRKTSSGRIYQYISQTHYSLLINVGIAYFNLSAYMGCKVANREGDKVLIDVRCFDEFFSGPVCGGIKTNNNVSGFQYYSTTSRIITRTVHLRVWVEIVIASPSGPENSIKQECFLDNIHLSIFKKDR